MFCFASFPLFLLLLLITRFCLSCRAFQPNIIWWFGLSLVKWLLISRSRILGIPVWLSPQKKCESLLANCGENRLQSKGNEKQQQQKTKTKTKNKKNQEGLLPFSSSFLFALACFLSIFFSFYFCVVWFWGFFCSRNLHFGPSRLSNSKCVILQYWNIFNFPCSQVLFLN